MRTKICLLLLIVSLCTPLSTFAKKIEKEYEKLIKTYDVPPTAKTASNKYMFWSDVMHKNERVATIFKAIKNKSSLAKKAAKKMNAAEQWSNIYMSYLYHIPTYNDLLEEVKKDMGLYEDVKLYVIDETGEFNAFTYPDGRIFLEEAMLLNSGLTYNMLLGICAHEYAHFLLFHSFTEYYQVAKRERRNNIITGITAGLTIASATFAAANGVETRDLDRTIANLFDGAELDKNRFRYKYSREQEIEADIIAYRFLDYIGVGGEEYIKALELMGRNSFYITYSSTSNHPSPSYRIGLLRYMQAHPEIVRIPPKYVLAEDGTIGVQKARTKN